MKIAFAIGKDEGLNSLVYGHFGRALNFAIYDEDTEKIDIIQNKNNHWHNGHNGHNGNCQPVDLLANKEIKAFVCGGMGPNAVYKLNSLGIKVYFADNTYNLEEAIRKWKNKEFKEFTVDNFCSHGHHHHG
ncbi:MAG: NifB/NifX family molybdenum-iron cluster-binding protein [Exilispira sp.]